MPSGTPWIHGSKARRSGDVLPYFDRDLCRLQPVVFAGVKIHDKILAFWPRAAGGAAGCGRAEWQILQSSQHAAQEYGRPGRLLVPQRVKGRTGGAHAWRACTTPGTISGVHTCRSSLCKGCLTMSPTTTLRMLI